MDVDEHSLGIDVRDLEVCSFPDTKTKGVDDFQACPVVFELDMIEYVFDFLPAQDNRELFFLFRSDEFKTCPVSFQGDCEEMFDATERDG
jgi:hypothetical protein